MNHNQYQEAIEKDKKYVLKNRDCWEAKLVEATSELARWEGQLKSMNNILHRVEFGKSSAFNDPD